MIDLYKEALVECFGKALTINCTCTKNSKALLTMCYYLYDSFRYMLLDSVKCENLEYDKTEADLLLQEFYTILTPEEFFFYNSAFTYLISCMLDKTFTELDLDSIHNLMVTVGTYINCRELRNLKDGDNLILAGIYSNKEINYTVICYKFS